MKLEGLFNVTQFDRLLQKQLSTDESDKIGLEKFSREMIKAYMAALLLQPRSQRDFLDNLGIGSVWRGVCGFANDLPVQSTFSRYWNNPAYHDPTDKLFLGVQELVKHKNIHSMHELPPEVMKVISAGYLPVAVDATFLVLSPKRFDYATKGYAAMEKTSEFGAKINLTIDCILHMPLNYIPTTGNVHETKSIDVLIDELLKRGHPWLVTSYKRQLRMFLILDRGYWDKHRFLWWAEHGVGFVCPRKRKTLTGAPIEFLEFPPLPGQSVEGLVWIDTDKDPLRWIVGRSHSTKHRYWDLITSDFKLKAKDIISAYAARWPIEEVFKWLKQYTNLKKPLTASWDGFVFHCYMVFILIMLLMFFVALLGLPRWQENLTELWGQLRYSSDEPWDFSRLRVPLAVFQGGMD